MPGPVAQVFEERIRAALPLRAERILHRIRETRGGALNDSRFEWQFLTARSVPELLPVLDGFGQDVRVEKDASGRPTRTMNHMLKMFLIDPDGVVREIYSLAFLQQPVMLNDIKTLALERDAAIAGTH